jgi:hypothetical protein
MKRRSTALTLTVVPLLAAAFQGCGGNTDDTAYCVDQNDVVVENSNCGDERSGGAGFFWYYGAAALAGNTIRRGARVTGGERISATDKGANVSRGGFGSSARSSSGVGRPVSGSGGGFFSGGSGGS